VWGGGVWGGRGVKVWVVGGGGGGVVVVVRLARGGGGDEPLILGQLLSPFLHIATLELRCSLDHTTAPRQTQQKPPRPH